MTVPRRKRRSTERPEKDETPVAIGIVESGQHHLQDAVTAYLCALAFATTFLSAIVFGAGLGTSLLRGVLVLVAARFLVPILVKPAVGAVLDAMARDRQEQLEAAAAAAKELETEDGLSPVEGEGTI